MSLVSEGIQYNLIYCQIELVEIYQVLVFIKLRQTQLDNYNLLWEIKLRIIVV